MNVTSNVAKCVEVLVVKAAKTDVAVEALQFSQAACNVANALAQLGHVTVKPGEAVGE